MTTFKLALLLFLLPFLSFGQVIKQRGEIDQAKSQEAFLNVFASNSIPKSHLFGIGVLEKLKGYVMILDGKFLSTSIKDTYLKSDTISNLNLNALVYAQVNAWKIEEVEAQIDSLAQFEFILDDLANKQGIGKDENFVFMTRTHINNIGFNVIDWTDGQAFEPENPFQSAHKLYETDTDVLLLGFNLRNSRKATNQKSNLNVYVATESHKPVVVGRLDSIEIKGKLTIYLPQKQTISR